GSVSSILLPDVQSHVVQLIEGILHVLLISADGALIGMYIVSELPIALPVLLGKAISIVGSMLGPGVHRQRIVLVDDFDFVAILRQDLRHEGAVHAGTEGTLEVVIVDDRDLGIGVSAHRAAC